MTHLNADDDQVLLLDTSVHSDPKLAATDDDG